MHSPQAAELMDEIRSVLASIRPHSSPIPFYSTVTGGRLDTKELDADYWCRNLRRTVRFEQAARLALGHGHRLFVELSPHPVLAMGLRDTFEDAAPDAVVVGTLHRDRGGMEQFLHSLARAHVHGAQVDWTPVFSAPDVQRVDLPTYAFQRQPCRPRTPGDASPVFAATGSPRQADRFSGPPEAERRRLLELVRRQVAEVLRLPGADAVEPERGFEEIGLDSAAALELRDGLAQAAAALPRRGSGHGRAEQNTNAPAATRDHLLGLPPEGQNQALLELVQTHAATVLGHTGTGTIEARREIRAMGFDSLTVIELRNRLAHATGCRLPATAVFDHPTPMALARDLRTRLTAGDPASGSASGVAGGGGEGGTTSDEDTPNTIASMFLDACASGQAGAGIELIKAASRLRPTFDHPGGEGPLPEATLLAQGDGRPLLVCFPTIAGPPDRRHYAGFASALENHHDVWHVPLPGFAAGERLPATVDAIVELLSDTARKCVGEAPFALVGQCAGGWFAHEVAHRLEGLGMPPAGVVLMDTYPPDDSAVVFETAMNNGMWERVRSLVPVDHAMVSALGGYIRVFADWTPAEIAAPTLLDTSAHRPRSAGQPPQHAGRPRRFNGAVCPRVAQDGDRHGLSRRAGSRPGSAQKCPEVPGRRHRARR